MHKEFRRQTLVKLAKIVTPGPISSGIVQQYNLTEESLQPEKANEFKPVALHVPNPGAANLGSVRVLAPPGYGIKGNKMNVMFHFRGAGNGSIYSKAGTNAIVVAVDAPGVGGGGMASYGNAKFVNGAVSSLLHQVRKATGNPNLQVGSIGFSGWSGGYDPIGRIIRKDQWDQIPYKKDRVYVADGIHYGKAGQPRADLMQPWLELAQRAQRGEVDFTFTHTAVKPGRWKVDPATGKKKWSSYASTTDSANWLLEQTGTQRQTAPGVASRADSGRLHIIQLYDQSEPYKARHPVTGRYAPNVPGTAGYQHIQALRRSPEFLPGSDWA